VLVHCELAPVATRGAHRSTACWHCRARELTAKGAKGRGHSGDPTDCTDGRRRGGVRPAMRRTIGGGARSALGKCRRGKVELDGAHCCKMNDRGVGAFI
jgi:hypothetical protein